MRGRRVVVGPAAATLTCHMTAGLAHVSLVGTVQIDVCVSIHPELSCVVHTSLLDPFIGAAGSCQSGVCSHVL